MNSNLKNYSLLLIACIIWGLTPLCGRILKDCMSPMLITGLRFSIASSIIFIVLAFTEPVFDSYTQIKTAQSFDTTGVALF